MQKFNRNKKYLFSYFFIYIPNNVRTFISFSGFLGHGIIILCNFYQYFNAIILFGFPSTTFHITTYNFTLYWSRYLVVLHTTTPKYCHERNRKLFTQEHVCKSPRFLRVRNNTSNQKKCH